MSVDKDLETACEHSDADRMIAALSAGANPNLVVDGMPVLHIAAANGFGEVIEVLLDRKVDLNQRDRGGMTALMWLAGFAHTDAQFQMLDRILTTDVALEVRHAGTDQTALDMAARWNNHETGEKLLRAGAIASRRQTKLRVNEWRDGKSLDR